MSTVLVIGAITAGVGALVSAGVGIGGKASANKQARIEEAKARKMQKN